VNKFLLVLLVCTHGWAGSYGYHPSTTLFLGAGFEPLHPDRAFQSCIAFDGKTNVDGPGAINTSYSLSLVKSRKDLYNALSLSADLSAHALFWGAGASTDYFHEHQFQSDSMTWMVLGRSDYGRFVMNNVRLTPAAQNLIDTGKAAQFAQMCGREYVQQERRGVLIAAIFSLENVSEEQRSHLESQFNASYGGGFFSIEAKAKYASFYRTASNVSHITMSIYAVGGEGITKFSDLVVHPDDLGEIQEQVRRYMASLSATQAAPLEYLSGSMTAFGYTGDVNTESHKRERVLAELFYRYSDAYSIYKRLEEILKHQTGDYQRLYNLYGTYLTTLLDAADKCYDNTKDCVLPTQEMERVVWPVDAISECERLRLKAYERHLIDEQELAHLRSSHMAPILRENTNTIAADVMCEVYDLGA